jgi:hypothetical protein
MGPFIDSKPTGEFDLTRFQFIYNVFINPQPATFNKKDKFNELVNKIGAWCHFDQNTRINICLSRQYGDQ